MTTVPSPRTGTTEFRRTVPHVSHDVAGASLLVVALHGMGQSPETFAGDALPLLPPGASLLLPRGPYPFEMRREPGPDGRPRPPREGNAWYVWTGDSDAFRTSLEHVEAWLLALVEAESARQGIAPGRAVLLGFSQGGYLAGFAGVRNPDRFRAVVVAGGRIKDEFLAGAAPRAAAAGLRVLHVHGTEDPFVHPEACRASLERLASRGVEAEFRTYGAGHSVLRDERCRADVREWIAARAADPGTSATPPST